MASFVITEGPAKGQQFALERHRLVMIGRDEGCTFQIVDPQLSRRHLQIRLDENEDRHYAIDFGSQNGVNVNGNRIGEDTPLCDGDVIQIGSTTGLYSVQDSPDATRVRELLRKHGEGGLTTAQPE